MLEVRQLKFKRSTSIAGYDYLIDFKLNSGSMNLLFGPTGSGKSSLLHTIAGLTAKQAGLIKFESQTIDHLLPSQRPICLMFQEFNLLEYLSVNANIRLGFTKKTIAQTDFKRLNQQLTDQFKLPTKQIAAQLSGGQKQLVALIRILLRMQFVDYPNFNNKLILLDEPLIGLDIYTKQTMIKLLLNRIKKQGHTLLLTSHDIDFIKQFELSHWQLNTKQTPIEINKIR